MSITIRRLENENRKIVSRLGNYSVLEYSRDPSVAPDNAVTNYFMGEMGVRKRQLMVQMDGTKTLVMQAGAMQWIAGDVNATTGVKGVGDLLGKMMKSKVTSESAIKPEYVGSGIVMLEPTYKYILLQDVADWGPQGMVMEDGMFLACDGSVKQTIAMRNTFSSAVAGGEGLFNLCLSGRGFAALESNLPMEELVEIVLDNDVLKIDGSNAVCWSASLQFTVERSSKSLVGSMVNGEGLVNVYRGTGKVLMSPLTAQTATWSQPAHK